MGAASCASRSTIQLHWAPPAHRAGDNKQYSQSEAIERGRTMRMGMVGLGRMGGNMTKRLIEHGHEIVAYDRNPDVVTAAEAEGALPANSLEEVVKQLQAPRAVWVMVPSGDITEQTC